MHVLLAEDDIRLGETMRHYLIAQKFQVEWVTNGADALTVCLDSRETPFDVVLLDWMMPDLTGVALIKKLRAAGYQRAIMLVTARDALDDRVEGLTSGADDYIVKPFAMPELVARIVALSRRNFAAFESNELIVGPLVLDRFKRVVKRDEEEVLLSAREFELLEWLVRHPERIFSKQALLERIWGTDCDVTMNAVEAAIKLLRKKLDVVAASDWIDTIRGVGYRLTIRN